MGIKPPFHIDVEQAYHPLLCDDVFELCSGKIHNWLMDANMPKEVCTRTCAWGMGILAPSPCKAHRRADFFTTCPNPAPMPGGAVLLLLAIHRISISFCADRTRGGALGRAAADRMSVRLPTEGRGAGGQKGSSGAAAKDLGGGGGGDTVRSVNGVTERLDQGTGCVGVVYRSHTHKHYGLSGLRLKAGWGGGGGVVVVVAPSLRLPDYCCSLHSVGWLFVEVC